MAAASSTTTISTSSSPLAKFRYISQGIEPTPSPHLYHLPPLAEFGDVRSLPIHNIRPSLTLGDSSPFKLDVQGFTARHHPSALHSAPYTRQSWSTPTLLKEIYIPEVEALIKHLTGAKHVITDQAVMRTNTFTEVDGLATSEDKDTGSISSTTSTATETSELSPPPDFPKLIGVNPGSGASPAPKVHLDYSPTGARTHLRSYHPTLTSFANPITQAEDSLLSSGIDPSSLKDHYNGPRWSFFSIWRPLKPVTRDPLALSDCSTFPHTDYVEVDITFPSAGQPKTADGGTATHIEKSYLARGPSGDGAGQRHDWYWISGMQAEEVLVIQLFDSEAEREGRGMGGGVMHSSVEVEGQGDLNEGEEARESLEVRCLAVW